MATTGTIRNDFRTGYAVQVYWAVNSQNVANNTTNVTVYAQLVSTGSSYSINSSATKNGTLTINGTSYSFTFLAGLTGNQTKTVFTKTVDIPHNSDGTKTCSMSCDLGINVTLSGTYYGTVSASGSGVFNTIARASTFTLNVSTIDAGGTITATITRASTSFTHNVYYSFGLNTWSTTGATTSASYTIPLADLDAIPNSTSGTATISVDTYSGGTYIGSASKSFTITAPSTVKPSLTSVSATCVDAGANPTSYGYVQGKSKCTLTINGATGSNGSTIAGYTVTGGGYTGSSASYTTGVLSTTGTITFTATVTDSRGRVSSAKTVNISVQTYSNPSIASFTSERCLNTGVINGDGTYAKSLSTFSYSPLGVGGNNTVNTLTSTVQYRKTGTSTWSTATAITTGATGVVIGGGLIDTASSYEVILTLTDKFTTVTKTLIIPTAFVTLDFKNGGKGIAIGKASETDNVFESAMPMKFSSAIATGSNIFIFPSTGSGAGIKRYTDQGALGMYSDSSMTLFAGDNIDKVTNMLGATREYEFLNLVADQDVRIITNVQDVLTDGTGGASKMFNFTKGGCLEITTDSVDAGTGIKVISSTGITGNWWSGSGGTVLQSVGSANLHLGQNNTSDMTFYADRIETKKVLVPLAKVSINKPASINDAQVSINTAGDGNASGDGVTHLGYWTGTGYNHYFRGKGIMNINNLGGTYVSISVSSPSFVNTSDREAKYDITKYDTEILYDYVKDLNIYGYRHSEVDMQFEGEERRQDMWIGSMTQELPMEVVDYDTSVGEGKGVNAYSYATMIAGATKELITKTERLETTDSEKQDKINELEQRILILEGK